MVVFDHWEKFHKKQIDTGNIVRALVSIIKPETFNEDIILPFTTIMDIIFWGFFILYQIFFSQQVKQSAVNSNKHGMYKLLHELPNKLRLRILGNQERSEKFQNFIEL